MITVGGRELLVRPISFEPAIINIGDQTTITGPTANIICMGFRVTADATLPILIGTDSTNRGDHSIAIGHAITVPANNQQCVLIGDDVTLHGTDTLANVLIGRSINQGALSSSCVVVGDILTVGNSSDVVVNIGRSNTVGNGSGQATVVGYNNTVPDNAPNCTVIGQSNAVSGPYTDTLVVHGSSNNISGLNLATVIGQNNTVVGAGSGYVVIIGDHHNIHDTGLSVIIGRNCSLPTGMGAVIAIGAGISVAAGKGGLGGILIGNGSTLTANAATGIAIGVGASAGDHQCVIGASEPTHSYEAINQFIVRGLSGTGPFTAIDVINVISNPADGDSGLTVVYNSAGTFSTKTLKASTSPPVGALLAYFAP